MIDHDTQSNACQAAEADHRIANHLGMICSALGPVFSDDVVIVESLASECTIAPHRLIPTAQIVTEVITNAIKYGRRPGRSGRIEVSCSKDASGAVLVEIHDNGPGLSANRSATTTRGVGSRLVQALVGQIDGTIEYRSNHQGLTVCLSIPRARTQADAKFEAGRAHHYIHDTTHGVDVHEECGLGSWC